MAVIRNLPYSVEEYVRSKRVEGTEAAYSENTEGESYHSHPAPGAEQTRVEKDELETVLPHC